MEILRLADLVGQRNHGAIGRRAMLAEGATEAAVDHAVHIGALITVEDGVYRGIGVPPSFELDLACALEVHGRFSLASHRSAAELWGVRWGDPPVVELTALRTASARTRTAVVHRPRQMDERDIMERRGFPVTSPARTVVDLGAVLDDVALVKAVEGFVIAKWASVSQLRWLCDRLSNPRRLGPKRVRAILDARSLGDQAADSPLEVHFGDLCVALGLEPPVFQYRIKVGGAWRRIDFAYPELKLAIEVDGWTAHMEWPTWEADHVRQNDLTLMGWQFLRFTWHMVVNDPEYVKRTLLAALEHSVA